MYLYSDLKSSSPLSNFLASRMVINTTKDPSILKTALLKALTLGILQYNWN